MKVAKWEHMLFYILEKTENCENYKNYINSPEITLLQVSLCYGLCYALYWSCLLLKHTKITENFSVYNKPPPRSFLTLWDNKNQHLVMNTTQTRFSIATAGWVDLGTTTWNGLEIFHSNGLEIFPFQWNGK